MKLLTILLALLLTSVGLCAQDTGNGDLYSSFDPYSQLPQSTTAAALSKYVNYPVNHGTGLVDIKIPLYELTVDDITIPIYLSYHASGIKIGDPYSWVGAGWTLHAEPSVSRTVVGLPDEQDFLLRTLTNPVSDSWQMKYRWQFEKSVDKMPDKYYYSLFDKQGGFYFNGDENHTAVLHPFEPVKLARTTAGFEITDENGLIYSFGGDEYVCTSCFGTNLPIVGEWKCNKVRSQSSGREVNFSYAAYQSDEYFHDDYIAIEEASMRSGASDYPYANSLIGMSGVIRNGESKKLTYYNHSGDDVTFRINGRLDFEEDIFRPVPADLKNNDRYLSAITCGEFRVEFTTCMLYGAPVLDKMKVYRSNTKIRELSFYLTKMRSNPVTSTLKEHCKLDGIKTTQETGGGVYSFEYYSPSDMPLRNSKNMDFWGYYNGSNNTTLVYRHMASFTELNTNQSHSFMLGNANREPNEDYMAIGSLKRIVYPTGGYTALEYEPHQYSYLFRPPGFSGWYQEYFGGGLRIRKITDSDGSGTPIVRNFSYTPGHCRRPPMRQYNDPIGACTNYLMKEYTYHYYATGSSYQNIQSKIQMFEASPLMDLPVTQGAPVVYDCVTEERSDGSRSVYYYSHADIDTTTPEYLLIDRRNSWMYGLLDYQAEYKKDAATENYKLVHSLHNSYGTYNYSTGTGYLNADNIRLFGSLPGADILPYSGSFSNNIQSGCLRLTEVRDSLFDDTGHASVTQTNYRYTPAGVSGSVDPLALQRQITVTHSDGTVTSEEEVYPTDVTGSGNSQAARNWMVNHWTVDSPLEQKRIQNGTVVTSVGYDYDIINGSGEAPRLTALRFGKTNANKVRIQYAHYTKSGKPMYKITDGVRKAVYLYSYDDKLLIAEIKNATYEQVRDIWGDETEITTLCDRLEPTEADWSKLKNMHTQIAGVHVTLFKHSPGIGVTEISSPGTLPVIYGYDGMGRLIDTILSSPDGADFILEHLQYNYKNH